MREDRPLDDRDERDRLNDAEDIEILGHGYTGSKSDQRKMLMHQQFHDTTPMVRDDYIRILKNWDKKPKLIE